MKFKQEIKGSKNYKAIIVEKIWVMKDVSDESVW